MGTLDGLKAAADVLRAADKIPEYQQILDAMEKMADLRSQLSDAQDRIRSLQTELDAVRADQRSAEGIRRVRDLYVLGDKKYCPGCWEMDKRLAPVVTVRKQVAIFQCCRCKQEFEYGRNASV